ncbi:hypothetical protein BJX64DRAFT_277191 [Aspergillus heterothallicus]
MPPKALAGKAPKIRRGHTGCKTCRKRGKKCDEAKPYCRACIRLKLHCRYAVDYTFRHHDQHNTASAYVLPQVKIKKAAPTLSQSPDHKALVKVSPIETCFPTFLDCGSNLEATYWGHFQRHVRHLLPAGSALFAEGAMQSPSLRFAALCISASNLSMLNSQAQHRAITKDLRRSVTSPLVNKLHHAEAQAYHGRALVASLSKKEQSGSPAELAALVLLAYYHHASTDHSKFRLAVWDTVRFVLLNKEALLQSAEGMGALQIWYRLCISHRLSKPPALMLEGEGPSAFGPNRFPDTFDNLFLCCILSLSSDDLIYDILIKSIEIRSRLVLFRCVAGSHQKSEPSDNIGSVAYRMLNKLLGRDLTESEQAEAEQGFVRGSNLTRLLEIQRQRLQVWKSRLNSGQVPRDLDAGARFPSHRDAMNVLYFLLCEMMFAEGELGMAAGTTQSETESLPINLATLAGSICQVAASLDFRSSNTQDVYTFSLSEVLLQLVLIWRSETVFHLILDVVWPQMESKSRGYEHSHYPTHLAKRIITEIARYWDRGQAVTFVQPAVTEDIPKTKLLDIDHPIDVVVAGYGRAGGYFIKRIHLP